MNETKEFMLCQISNYKSITAEYFTSMKNSETQITNTNDNGGYEWLESEENKELCVLCIAQKKVSFCEMKSLL